MNSIILVQDEILKSALPLLIEHNREQQRTGGQNIDFTEHQSRKKGTLEERLTILSVAYHNFAVELEYLNKYDQSLHSYQKAHEFSSQYLGPENRVSQNLKGIYDTAKETITKKLSKIKKDEKLRKGVNTQKAKETKEKKDFIKKKTPLADRRPPTDSRSNMKKSFGGTGTNFRDKDLDRQEGNKNVLQKPGQTNERTVHDGLPKIDRRQNTLDQGIESKRSDSRDDRHGNGSGSGPHQDDSHSHGMRKQNDKSREDRDRIAAKWDGMLSSKMDDSDRGDPDEMVEEPSE